MRITKDLKTKLLPFPCLEGTIVLTEKEACKLIDDSPVMGYPDRIRRAFLAAGLKAEYGFDHYIRDLGPKFGTVMVGYPPPRYAYKCDPQGNDPAKALRVVSPVCPICSHNCIIPVAR